MVLSGTRGHPSHRPLTDVTLGAYSIATAFGVLSVIDIAAEEMAVAWWLSLVAGLVATVPTVLTGLLDWMRITRGTALWRTATAHLAAMVTGTVFFGLAAIVGHSSYTERDVGTLPLVLTLVGFGLLAFGGWLGGTLVYRYGMRVERHDAS